MNLWPALCGSFLLLVTSSGCSLGTHWPPAVSSASDIDQLPQTQRDIRGINLGEPEILLIANRFSNLDYLFLNSHSTITDTSAIAVARLEKLRQIVINDGSDLTDKGLAAISEMVALRELIIDNGEHLTNASLDSLARNRRLKLLYLNGCPNLTSEAKARIREQLPNCKIRFD
ncbi:leucine-rich repeat domain-containing protein [Crateriforma conspicua]|nr:hypothetical protein [Crateriforma conspicua]